MGQRVKRELGWVLFSFFFASFLEAFKYVNDIAFRSSFVLDDFCTEDPLYP